MNPNAQDGDGRTALISAAARGDLETVNALIARSADINVRDKRGYTALAHAIEARYDQVEDALLSKSNLDPNCRGLNGRPALLAYVWRDDKERVEKLLARGADVNLQDNDGDTALHGAAESGNVEIVRLLLSKDAKLDVKNKQGGTPLMWAAARGNEEAAALLLSQSADPSLKDNDGITAAQWAVRNKRENIVQLFRSKR
jgi:serine/threonine-protein phosphatase 6 regulatory ankyrin repeat subunit B